MTVRKRGSSWTITLRFTNSIYDELLRRANEKGLSIGIYVKTLILDDLGVDGRRICEKCGWEGVCDTHHKDMNHSNNIPTNLQTLCPNCHRAIHWGRKWQ